MNQVKNSRIEWCHPYFTPHVYQLLCCFHGSFRRPCRMSDMSRSSLYWRDRNSTARIPHHSYRSTTTSPLAYGRGCTEHPTSEPAYCCHHSTDGNQWRTHTHFRRPLSWFRLS